MMRRSKTANWTTPGVLWIVALALAIHPANGAAQIGGDDWEDPTVSISPSGGTFSNPSVSVTVTWCDNVALNSSSRQIKHNGVNKTSSFGYTSTGGGCYQSSGTLTLTVGSNTVYGYICDTSWLCSSKTVTLTYTDGKKAPIVSALESQDLYDPSMCGFGCADFSVSYSTPSYRSLDVERSTTMLYRSDMARPMPTVVMQAYDTSTEPADTISVRLKRDWTGAWQTLHTGSTEVYYDNPNTQNNKTLVSVAFDAGNLATGAYDYTAYVYSRWRDGTVKETQIPVRALVVNEETSPYGWGWTIAGLQRIHTQVLGGSDGVVLTDGTGAIGFFEEASCTGSPVHCLYDTPAGWTGDLEYDAQFTGGRRYRRWFDNGTEIYYDAAGRMVTNEDRYGNKTTYAYDGSGRVTSITDPVGKATTFAYGGDGKLAWIKDPGNRTSTVWINGSYDVTQVQDPAGGKPLQGLVYSGHRMTRYKDRANSQWDVVYDFAGRVSTVTAPTIKLHNGTSTRPVTATRSAQHWLMDASSSLASPGTRRFNWHRRVRVTDPEGHETAYRVLSEFGQPERIEMERGRVARVLYDSNGRMTREVSPAGDSVSYTWSGGRMTKRTDHTTGLVTNYTYTSHGNVSVVSGSGQPTAHYHYGTDGAPDSLRVNGSRLYSFATDSNGRITNVTDAGGYQQQFQYFTTGAKNRSQVTRGAETTKERYDSHGRVLHLINAVNDTVTYAYDNINRVTSVKDESNETTSFGYSSMFRTSVTDAEGHVYTNYPNALGWDTVAADPASGKEKFGYDRDGSVRTYTNRRNSTVSYVFNDAHEMTSRTADGQTTTYTVSADLLTTTSSNAASTDTVKVILNGRDIEQRTTRQGYSWEVDWDHDNQWRPTYMWIRRNGANKHNVDYNYNSAGGLSRVAASYLGQTDLGYDSRLNAETYRWSMTTDTLALSHPTYGGPGRFRYSDASVEATVGLRYQRDALKRISERWNGDQTEWDEFQHNPVGMLTEAKTYTDSNPSGGTCDWDFDNGEECDPSGSAQLQNTETFTWDGVGNPASGTITNGRLTAFDGLSFSYDADGNVIQRTGGGETITYWWNSLSQLDSANSSTLGKVRYRYDGWGRRVYANDATGTTHFLWDEDDVVADINSSGTATRYYNYYPGMSNLHSMRVGLTGYLYVKDVTGNVIGLQDTSGSLVNSYEYSPFGDLESVSETVSNRFRFASGEQDRLGQYYLRARFYDPEYRRFISEDPIGLAGGINPYLYAGNNPIDNRDATGLKCEEKVVDGETVKVGPDGVACAEIEGLDVVWDSDKANGYGPRVLYYARAGFDLWAPPGSNRRKQAQTCGADAAQTAATALLTAAQVTALTSIRRVGQMRAYAQSWKAAGLAGSETARSWMYHAGNTYAGAMVVGYPTGTMARVGTYAFLGGSPNPLTGGEGLAYAGAKAIPFLGLGMDIGETLNSCGAMLVG